MKFSLGKRNQKQFPQNGKWRIGLLLFCLLLTCTMAFSQERTVFGTITDASGKPFAGVVVIKGTTSGTVTSSDGNYSIKVSHNAILMFSFVGLTPQ